MFLYFLPRHIHCIYSAALEAKPRRIWTICWWQVRKKKEEEEEEGRQQEMSLFVGPMRELLFSRAKFHLQKDIYFAKARRVAKKLRLAKWRSVGLFLPPHGRRRILRHRNPDPQKMNSPKTLFSSCRFDEMMAVTTTKTICRQATTFFCFAVSSFCCSLRREAEWRIEDRIRSHYSLVRIRKSKFVRNKNTNK